MAVLVIEKGGSHMPGKSNDPIGKPELDKFIAEDSDFGFEMRVLAEFRAVGFDCLHSGTYTDPVTKKIRQFDIRAAIDKGEWRFALAVECKNLRTPLLISAVPRTPQEAFHCVIRFRGGTTSYHAPVVCDYVTDGSIYKADQPVGKKTDQIRREGSKLTTDDSATFDKMGQAINSTEDLVKDMISSDYQRFRVVVPVLVVPRDMLWQVDYDADGQIVVGARMVDRATIYMNHDWEASYSGHSLSYAISHLEIITRDSLAQTVTHWMGTEGFFHHPY
jgi:hypothetical protein